MTSLVYQGQAPQHLKIDQDGNVLTDKILKFPGNVSSSNLINMGKSVFTPAAGISNVTTYSTGITSLPEWSLIDNTTGIVSLSGDGTYLINVLFTTTVVGTEDGWINLSIYDNTNSTTLSYISQFVKISDLNTQKVSLFGIHDIATTTGDIVIKLGTVEVTDGTTIDALQGTLLVRIKKLF